MKVKTSKCKFHQNETEYLGFIIGQEGVKTDPVKTQVIWHWATPKKIKDPMLPGVLEPLLTIYRGFQPNGQTTICEKKQKCIGNGEWGHNEY